MFANVDPWTSLVGLIAGAPGAAIGAALGATSGLSSDAICRAFASQAVSAEVQNPEIGRMQTAYAVVFRGAFAASASMRAEIASKAASFACSIDAMA